MAKLGTVGPHEEELVPHAEPCGLAADSAAESGNGQAQNEIGTEFAGEGGVGRTGDPDRRAAGAQYAQRLLEVLRICLNSPARIFSSRTSSPAACTATTTS